MNDVNDTENNSTLLHEREEFENTYRIVFEVLAAFTIVPILIDLFVIFVILKFRRLREHKSNIIILHFLIVNVICWILIPFTLRIVSFYEVYFEFRHVFCIISDAELIAVTINILLLVLLSMYWYINKYYPHTGEKFARNINVFLGIIYLLGLFFWESILTLALMNEKCSYQL